MNARRTQAFERRTPLPPATFHDGQCNHEYSPQQLRRIGALDIPLCISCDDSSDP